MACIGVARALKTSTVKRSRATTVDRRNLLLLAVQSCRRRRGRSLRLGDGRRGETRAQNRGLARERTSKRWISNLKSLLLWGPRPPPALILSLYMFEVELMLPTSISDGVGAPPFHAPSLSLAPWRDRTDAAVPAGSRREQFYRYINSIHIQSSVAEPSSVDFQRLCLLYGFTL
jgi:hypothetical protein